MEEIIKKLKQEIINHNRIKNSSLLSSFQWKRAQYIVLSDIISESLSKSEFMQGSKKNELGVTISSSTLQRIFTNDYIDRKSNDLRFLKTLDKLAIFLGYPNLNNFLLHQFKNEKKQFEEEQLKDIQEVQNIEGIDVNISFFTEIIINSCKEEFENMKKLPVFEMGKFSEYAFEESPVYKRISDLHLKFSELNLRMDCESNRSNFENYGFKLRNITEDTALIATKEFWNIHWTYSNGKTYHTYNTANNQLYFFRKIDGLWKIWDNHNPGYDSLATVFLKP
ncbi:MAG: hypothetical protein ABI426_09620 [Flavobacterium sp.]